MCFYWKAFLRDYLVWEIKQVKNQPKWCNYVITVQLPINLKSMWSYWFKTKQIVNRLMEQQESRDRINNH